MKGQNSDFATKTATRPGEISESEYYRNINVITIENKPLFCHFVRKTILEIPYACHPRRSRYALWNQLAIHHQITCMNGIISTPYYLAATINCCQNLLY
jgi:hypothetical protein